MLRRVYLTSFIFAIGTALTAYVNSTFVAGKVGTEVVGFAFAAEALITLIGLFLMPRLVEAIGNEKTLILLLALNLLGLAVLITSASPMLVVLFFIIYSASNNLVAVCFDIFTEHLATLRAMGSTRGTYLSLVNLAWLLAPLAAGLVITDSGYLSLYALAFLFAATTLFLVDRYFKKYKDPHYYHFSALRSIVFSLKHPDILRITVLNFLLQFFYAIMIIYTPIYLNTVIGFDWKTIGVIFTFMLLPFVLIELPLGKIADRIHNEKQLLVTGMCLMGIMTVFFGNHEGAGLVGWAVILFLTRVGASMVEVASESYFFKKINDHESSIISLFRTVSPIAFIVGPIFGAICLISGNYAILYDTLGVMLILGSALAIKLKQIR